jgi:hypothetical protein
VGFSFLNHFLKIPAQRGFCKSFPKGFVKSFLFLKRRMPKKNQNIVSSPIKPLFPKLGRRSDPDQEQCLLSIREA